MEKYSISRLNQYDKCKLAYYLKYKLKIRKPYVAHPSAIFGNLVHWAAEHNMWDLNIIRKEAEKAEYAGIKKADMGVELKRNIEAVKLYKETDDALFPTQQEEQWVNWDGANIRFCGKVDRILYNDKECKIVDYKTNSRVSTAEDYIPQLKFYNMMLLLGGTTKGRMIISELFFTRHNVTITEKFSKAEIFNFVKKTKDKIVEIENNEKWLPNASYSSCIFCDYRLDKKLCQVSRCNK